MIAASGACCSRATRRALLAFAKRHGLAILADEVYGVLAYDGPLAPIGSLDPDAARWAVAPPDTPTDAVVGRKAGPISIRTGPAFSAAGR